MKAAINRRFAVATLIVLLITVFCCCSNEKNGTASVSAPESSSAVPETPAEQSKTNSVETSSSEIANQTSSKTESSGDVSSSSEEEPSSSEASSSSEEASSVPEPASSSEAPPAESVVSAAQSSVSEAVSQSSSSQPEQSAAPVEKEPEAPTPVNPQSSVVEPAPVKADATASVLTPSAPGNSTYGNGQTTIDVSNSSEGYVCVKYTGGGSSRIKVLITKSGGTQYQYNINTKGNYEVLPLTAGNGRYQIGVFQNVSGNSYAQLYMQDIEVKLRGSNLPFLYPNQYVNFNSSSKTVAAGAELSRTAQNDLGKVSNVYNYVINNMTYDHNKASTVQQGGLTGYLPAVDSILASGKGICFDYAAVMATMLRSQQIPTKLVVGYSGNIYHAWINVWITDVGWVNGVVYFDGTTWKLMDPTFADSGGQSASIMTYINNPANYSPIYYY